MTTVRDFREYITFHDHRTVTTPKGTRTMDRVRFFVTGQLEDAVADHKGRALRLAYKRTAQLRYAKTNPEAAGPYWQDPVEGDQLLSPARPCLRLVQRRTAA